MRGRPPLREFQVTERQREVARLVAEGRTNPEIAAALSISLDGAKYHVSELLARLARARREDIAAWYRAQQGSPLDRARRRLRAALGLPVAWGTGAAAVLVVALVAGIAAATALPRASLMHAFPPDAPLPEQGWEVTLSPDYRDTDFIIAYSRYTEQPQVRLIDPATGLIAATIRTSYSPDVLVRREERQLLVSDVLSPGRGGEYRVLVFDLADDLAFLDEFRVSGRGGENRFWAWMNLSFDGRYLFHPWLAWQPGEDGGGYLDIIDLDSGESVRRPTGEIDCHYGRITPLADGTLLTRGYRYCRTEIVRLDAQGSPIQTWSVGDWRLEETSQGFPFITSDGRVGKIGRLGELDLVDDTGSEVRIGRLWDDGWVHGTDHATLRDGRIVMKLNSFDPHPELLVFNPDTLAIEHRVLMPFWAFQPRPDGEGAWVLRSDGTIHSVDWDGATKRVPTPPLIEGELMLAPRQ